MARRTRAPAKTEKKTESSNDSSKLVRVDAQRNLSAILKAALEIFETSGVDAPVRDIAEKAGVGIGTLYRHFPERSDLIKAVVQQGVDDCVAAAEKIADANDPGEALALWGQRLVDLLKTKRGLAAALHSGNPAYRSLPDYFLTRLTPTLKNLLKSAEASGAIRSGVDAGELLMAITRVATPASEGDIPQARQMVSILLDGLRFQDKRLRK